MFNLFSAKDMGIDLGTANTLIYIKDKGIVLNEPSVIAMDNRRGVTLAVGAQAKDMIGKAPANISVIRPLEDGVISDFDRTADMLKAFVEKAAATNKVKNFRVVVGDVDSSTACMIADIGGGTTDIAIIALGGIVASSSIRHAGDKFNDAIIQYMRKRHALLIGEKTAEYLKIQVGAACLDLDENGDEIITSVNASGRDIISGLPKILEVTNRDIMMALQESVDIIVDGVKATIEKAPPEIAADIAANGMILSGGGGMIHNLDLMIERRTGVKANIAENAFEAVALGTGMSLNNIEKLKIYATSINRR